MQDKLEFKKLPQEINDAIARFLPTKDLLHQVLVSKTGSAPFFQPSLEVRRFLHHVVCGEHEKVKAMLEKNVHLLYKKGEVTDCAGRSFESISGFEYALWALDKDMWALMLECIPKNEEGKEIIARLLTQYKKLETQGVSYSLNGKTITGEKHFDFEETIIKEWNIQIDSINAPEPKDWNAINEQWRKGVGYAQRLLPVHVVHWYCCEIPFSPTPKFGEQHPSPTKKFYTWITEQCEAWFHKDSKLGQDFAIYKGSRRGAHASGHSAPRRAGGWSDLTAMKALCEVRTNDFINLNQQLEEQLLVENQAQAAQI
ncbi:F-box protein [Fluoribacter gormanii]|uniref:F-box protein n=1 Tax=Fluoribacter gormanii TaxID=464 RepID=UPI001041ADEC|nr:F-box protein [Fluoribacter gormanii]